MEYNVLISSEWGKLEFDHHRDQLGLCLHVSYRLLLRIKWKRIHPNYVVFGWLWTSPGSKKYGAHLGTMWAKLAYHMGTIWANHMVTRWANMGLRCPIWYPYSICTVGPIWDPSGFPHMGPYGTHMGPIWSPCIPYGTHMGPIWAPYWYVRAKWNLWAKKLDMVICLILIA